MSIKSRSYTLLEIKPLHQRRGVKICSVWGQEDKPGTIATREDRATGSPHSVIRESAHQFGLLIHLYMYDPSGKHNADVHAEITIEAWKAFLEEKCIKGVGRLERGDTKNLLHLQG